MLSPQHLIAAVSSSAHVWWWPAATWTGTAGHGLFDQPECAGLPGPARRGVLGRMRQLLFLALAGLGVGCNNRSEPAAPAAPPEVGSVAPDFALVGSDGKTHRLSELRGKAVVLAWYRKAFTGG